MINKRNVKNSNKIEHIPAYSQGPRPICGIYAFLNGIAINGKSKDSDSTTINEIAKKLWKEAIRDNNALKNSYNNTDFIHNNGPYSLIGEFFSSCALYSFLKNEKKKILNEIESLGVVNYEVNKIKDGATAIKNIGQKDSFLIIPINSGEKKVPIIYIGFVIKNMTGKIYF